MPYLSIADFKYGMDRRRPQVAGIPGTLWILKNGVITRGGDINGAKKWVPTYSLPAGTFGLVLLKGQPYVFGSASTPGGMPTAVNYQRLQAPDSSDMARMIDAKASDGKIYAIAEYATGAGYHFYNGSRVTDWDSLSTGGNGFSGVAALLGTAVNGSDVVTTLVTANSIQITANTPGTIFTIASSTVDTDADSSVPTAVITHTQANVAPVAGVKAVGTVTITGGSSGGVTQVNVGGPSTNLIPPATVEVRATGTITIDGSGGSGSNHITSVKVNGQELLSSDVVWQGSKSATATNLKNKLDGSHGYNASSNGSTVTLTAPSGNGATWNGKDINISGAIQTSTQHFSGGVTASQPVPWSGTTTDTAEVLKSVINENFGLHSFVATRVGAVVTITAPTEGTVNNGRVVTVTNNGSVTTSKTNFSGGVDAIVAVAQIETVVISGAFFDAVDKWTVTINGVDYSVTGTSFNTGKTVLPFKKRVYSTAESLLRYSVLNVLTDWTTTTTPSTDSGFINVSTDSDGAQQLVTLAKFDGAVAIFARNSISIYQLDTDATKNTIVNSLENTGTFAYRSAISYGNTDVFYLHDTRIRSIRAQAVNRSPYLTDVGSAIDSFVQESTALVDSDTLARSVAAIEPTDGRYMIAIGGRVICLSFFPSAKITAWSYLEPGFVITDFASDGRRLYARSGDTVYVYGGLAGDVYPDEGEAQTEIETPFMAANDPAGIKILEGFDAALTGDWLSKVLVDPNDPLKQIAVNTGVFNRTTYPLPSVKIPGRTSHVAFRMTCASAGLRSLSSLALHYDKEGAQ